MDAPAFLDVNGVRYGVVRLLGKGKGGYSWLVEREGRAFVLKQLHHEPCDYYAFGDKLEAERRDYLRLKDAGIPIPERCDVDAANERILKEYVPGPTILELLKAGRGVDAFLPAVRALSDRARAAGLNLDWFPSNFVPRDGNLVYVDYECNAYADEWSFEGWGVRYWSMTPELLQYLSENP